MAQELRLLKAGLLYADRVKLYSLQAHMLSMLEKVANVPLQQQLRLLEMIAPFITTDDTADNLAQLHKAYKATRGKKHRTPQELMLIRNLETLMRNNWAQLKEVIWKVVQDAGIEEVNRAITSGLLDLHVFEGTNNDESAIQFLTECVAQASKSPKLAERLPEFSAKQDKVIGEFVRGISRAVTDGSAYPLFDEETGSLVATGIREEIIKVSESAVNRARHSGLAGQLLQRLPSFEDASIDEILDIRKELDRPLVRFRSAMISFSDGIKSAPWDDDFPADAETVFRRDVAPAIMEIEDEVKANNYFASLIRALVDKPLVLPAGSAISLVLSNLSSLPNSIAYTIGMGISTAAIIYDAYDEWKQKNKATEQNALYFYYRASKSLEK